MAVSVETLVLLRRVCSAVFNILSLMSFTRFGLLACELQQEIMRQCDLGDLARLGILR